MREHTHAHHGPSLYPSQVVAIEGLENILRHRPPPASGRESYLSFMDEAGVPHALDELMTSDNPAPSAAAYAKAEQFMLTYFPGYNAWEEDEGEEGEEDLDGEEGEVGNGGGGHPGSFFAGPSGMAALAAAGVHAQQQQQQGGALQGTAAAPFSFGGGFT